MRWIIEDHETTCRIGFAQASRLSVANIRAALAFLPPEDDYGPQPRSPQQPAQDPNSSLLTKALEEIREATERAAKASSHAKHTRRVRKSDILKRLD